MVINNNHMIGGVEPLLKRAAGLAGNGTDSDDAVVVRVWRVTV